MNELIIIIHFIDATPYGVTFFFFFVFSFLLAGVVDDVIAERLPLLVCIFLSFPSLYFRYCIKGTEYDILILPSCFISHSHFQSFISHEIQ